MIPDNVERFIAHFQNEGTVKTFTNGCCYWFARLLCMRFWLAVVVYNPISGHFAARYAGKLYDITGRLEDDGHWIRWSRYAAEEPADALRIKKYCIFKED